MVDFRHGDLGAVGRNDVQIEEVVPFDAAGAGAYPALANDPKLAAAGYSVLVVVNGSKDMPPFGALLDDEQVAAVVNYVRSHFGNSYPDSVSPTDVKSARP